MQWIKASEQMPKKQKNYHVKCKYDDSKPECYLTTSVWNMKHWEHPSKYDSYTGLPIKLNVYEWLDESQPLPVSSESDAVEFAEWIGKEDLKLYPEGWCQPGGSNGMHLSTIELYKLFKNKP